ncbi:MAG TPA: mycofactocin biosynthesis glycosyltransferase MftF, partial [Ilumatobacter sp.]|nr:mycofactocin biosynthesis glycosyltransferase MftF [Ilumatobacter sp.]
DDAQVTIVVPTHGEPAHVPPGAILVDDGSCPAVAGSTVRLDANRGPGAARNAGLAAVATPLVAFVDADVRVPTGWLADLLPHFDDDRVGLVAPRVRSRPAAGPLGRWERRHSPLDLGPDPARVRAGSRVSYVPAAAIVCRVDAVRQVGGFDETLRFGEDVDLVWRLDAAGWRCRYEPAVEAEHDPRPNWRAWARQRIGYGSSAAPLSRRHPGALAPVRVSGWSAAVWGLCILGRPVLAAAGTAATGAALVRKLPDVPPRTAFGLATTGTLLAGEQLAAAVRRAWWPIVALAAIRSARTRRMLVAALLAAGHPLRVVDDLAYSIGVWRGVARERTVAPLVPDLTSWPGRSTPSTSVAEPLPSTG